MDNKPGLGVIIVALGIVVLLWLLPYVLVGTLVGLLFN